MAESLPFGKSIDIGSDHVPEQYCEPCFEVHNDVKLVAGYCQNCDQELCFDCFSTHLRRKPFRSHKLVDKSSRSKTRPTQMKPQKVGEECLLHHGELLQSFCPGHSEFCCKVCLTINHQTCKTEEISKLASNIQDSRELEDLNNTLNTLKKGFKDNLCKTGANESVIQNNYEAAINKMRLLRDEFDKLMTETEVQADKVKKKDFHIIEKVSATCIIVIEQINKLTTNLDTLKQNGDGARLFFSMKRAESQIASLEKSLNKLDQDNTVREYKFEPNAKLAGLLSDIKVLGQLSIEISQPTGVSRQLNAVNRLSDQKAKSPTYVQDIQVRSTSDTTCNLYGSVVLPNNQIIITDWQNRKIKLIDTNRDKIISEIAVSGNPDDITKVKDDEFAVTVDSPNKIQFVSVSKYFLSKGRVISVNGRCRGIAYNHKDHSLIVTFSCPGKVEILNMSGNVIKCLAKDSKGDQLFTEPLCVALNLDMAGVYVTDVHNDTVTLMTLTGEIRAVYKDQRLQNPTGICVHRSGLVYVVGRYPHTVHQLDPVSCEFKLLLEQKNGLNYPKSISYCHLEDKMYIGMQGSVLKVFQMN